MNLDRVNDFFGKWWEVLVSFAAVAVIGVAGYVFVSVADDNAEQKRDREVSEQTNRQLAQIIKTERRLQDTRDERLSEAVEQVRRVFAESLQHHDAQMNRLMARQLDQIAQLLRRPEGTEPDPVTARPQTPPPSSSRPPPASSSTTTTTRPDQRNCALRPMLPRC